MKADVINPENLVLVPVEVPLQTGAQIAVTVLTALAVGALVGVATYGWGYDQGASEKRREMEHAFDQRVRALEARFEERVQNELRKQGVRQPGMNA
jgi:hypothetical protein